MSLRRAAVLAGAIAVAGVAARAEVVDVAENGFLVRETATVSGDSRQAWNALIAVGKWWDPAHTFSKDAGNLALDARAGGCFCETLPNRGSVEHMRVVFAEAGKTLRLDGGLGPLQAMAVTGVLTWTLTPAEKGTSVEMTYAVGGYSRGGFRDLPQVIDRVLSGQVARFRSYADTGKP
jgi:hypothetical protein